MDQTKPQPNTVVFDRSIICIPLVGRSSCFTGTTVPLSSLRNCPACRSPSNVDNQGSRKMENPSRRTLPGRYPAPRCQMVKRFVDCLPRSPAYTSVLPVQVSRLMSSQKSTRHSGIFHSRLCRIRACPPDWRGCQAR